MSIIKRTGQALVSTAWYAAHPKQALGAAVRKAVTLTLDNPNGWDVMTGGPTYTGKVVNEETILQVIAAWSAIRLISETIGTLPLHLYRETEAGREKAKDHKLYRLLHTQPNQYMTSVEWREAMAVSLCVWGQSYNYAPRLGDRVTGIIPVAKPQVRYELKDSGELTYYLTRNGKEEPLTREQIVPIKGFGGPGSLEGYPPYKYGRNAVAISAAAEEYAARFFGNGARPSGFLMIDKVLDPEQRKQLRAAFEMIHSGLENSHKLAILEAGMTYQQVTAKNSDAQLNETQKRQVAEIARLYRVPLDMLMEGGNSTYNNSEQYNKHFLEFTLRPYLVRIEQALNTTLLTRQEQEKGYFIEFDVRGLLRGDSKARAEYYRNMRFIGAMSINEVRKAENLPEREGADDLHVPLNMAPSDQLREILGESSDGKN